MSELNNESIQSASFVSAQTHISANDSHSSRSSSAQMRPRAIAAAQEVRGQIHTLTSSQPSFGSTTQIEPRVVAYEAALALQEEHEAARLAAISKTPTTKEIAALFTDALSDVRDARLFITSTHFPDDASQNSSIIPLPYKATGRVVFGVIQQAQDVDLLLRLPLKDTSAKLGTSIKCQIIYDPGRDHCLLVNLTKQKLRLTNFSSSPAVRMCTRAGKSCLIQPGMWRISIDDDAEDSGEYHVAEFCLLGRQFDFSILTADSSLRKKRGMDDGAEENANKRRKRNNDPPGTTFIQSTNKTMIEPRPATKRAEAHNQSSPLSVQMISVKAAVPLLNLADGDRAFIWALGDSTDNSLSLYGAKGPASYELLRIEQKGATRSANVFTCEHSAVPGRVVAKVLQYKRASPDEVRHSLLSWKTEKATLEKLKHTNIVALKAFDGRMLSMYLELLPDSLDRRVGVKFSQADIYRILFDVSSALVYLKTVPIVHNDIKPSNITYSPLRGAVLIDFGLATPYSEVTAGGTPWYLPPELLEHKERGSPGDIWALGITTLYLLGKINYPETSNLKWNIHKLDEKENRDEMKEWLRRVFSARTKLSRTCVRTWTSKLESIVYRMLEVDKDRRFEAEEIVSALDKSMARLQLTA